MRIVLEKIDDEFYMDVILDPQEIENLSFGEMIEGQTYLKYNRYYVGVRLQGNYDAQENDYWSEEDEKSDA